MASSRFPGKPLATLCGEPAVRHVVRRARQAFPDARLTVATDTPAIAEVVADLCPTFRCREEAACGTDRAAEVAASLLTASDSPPPRWVINLQGDEPCLPPDVIIDTLAALQRSTAPMASAAIPMTRAEGWRDPDVVKAIIGLDGDAHYFSRASIPARSDDDVTPLSWRLHVGLYAFRLDALLAFRRLGPSPLERAERLEQLRAIDAGWSIAMASLDAWRDDPWPALNRPTDLQAAEAWLERRGSYRRLIERGA